MNENYPYGYGGNNYSYNMYQNKLQKKAERKKIRRLGTLTGAALLCFIFMQNLIVSVFVLTGFYKTYTSNAMISTALDIIFSLIEMLPAFLYFGNKMKKETGISDIVPLDKPRDKKLGLLAVPAGVGICMAANIATSYITVFLRLFGVELSLPDIGNPSGAFGFVISVLRVAVVAGIVEEISLRGCVMQPLRKYGDGFAIVASACAFGLMHCNLIQAPFALIVGLGLGYIAVKTDSLVCVIIIHGINNLISTVISYLMDAGISDIVINMLYVFIIYVSIAVGSVCLFFFIKRAKVVSPGYPNYTLNSGLGKAWAYISNPTMIIAIIIMFCYTSKFVEVV